MKLVDWVVVQTRCLRTDVRVDIWTFVRTHETHDNPPAKSLRRASPRVSGTWIFTPSESHDGLGRARNMNVCALGSDYMWCQHILIKLLVVPYFVRPHILFSFYSCRHLAKRGSLEKQFKEHQLFWIWYTMSCTTWIAGTKLTNPILGNRKKVKSRILAINSFKREIGNFGNKLI